MVSRPIILNTSSLSYREFCGQFFESIILKVTKIAYMLTCVLWLPAGLTKTYDVRRMTIICEYWPSLKCIWTRHTNARLMIARHITIVDRPCFNDKAIALLKVGRILLYDISGKVVLAVSKLFRRNERIFLKC